MQLAPPRPREGDSNDSLRSKEQNGAVKAAIAPPIPAQQEPNKPPQLIQQPELKQPELKLPQP